MNAKRGQNSAAPPRGQEVGAQPMVKWATLGVLGLCVVVFAWRQWRPSVPPDGASGSTSATEIRLEEQREPAFLKPKPREETAPAPAVPLAEQTSASPAPVAPLAPVDADTSRLAAGLTSLVSANGSLTAEDVQVWRTNFQQLVQGGDGVVRALQTFLAQNQDVAFDMETARAVGYRSARVAAFDALRQIGGPEAAAVLEQTLGETTSPKEIAALAFELDQLAQGQYREKPLGRARDALATLGASNAQNVDVAPLFEVFQQYGDASIVPDLEKATGQWKYYALSALASLPDNAGLPALLTMADPSAASENRLTALEMVAQLAGTGAVARQALTAQVANKQIPANYWPYLSGPLAGDQYYPAEAMLTTYPVMPSRNDIQSTHVVSGNQNFYQLPSDVSLTPDGLNQRMALVNELIAVASDTAALQALQQAQTTLQNRMTTLAAASVASPARAGE
jgi:hypothetical protein